MLAAVRIGEIAAAADNWRTAAGWMGRAAEDHQDVYRLEWLLQGRERYFREIDAGDAPDPTPSLLSPVP
jgi:hypothetical protein